MSQAHTLLEQMLQLGASDLFITVGVPPSVKVNGQMRPIGQERLGPEAARDMVMSLMNERHHEEFLANKECNFALSLPGMGRFRVNAFRQRSSYGAVVRRINTDIPDLSKLNLPPIMNELAMLKRGLVIVVGATGSGKSTSLAGMVGHRNRHSYGHILSIEDPIEFVHKHEKSLVTQREVGIDTDSYDAALENALRQAPDVILIGEIRNRETMEFALQFAETGHLCMATLHANNANQALERIMHLVPEERLGQLKFDLAMNLRGIIAQQLVPTLDGRRTAAVEILLNTPLISDYIRKGELHLIKDVISKSAEQGMKTFDQALYELYSAGVIDQENALLHADSPNDLRLMIKLDQGKMSSGLLKNASIDY